MNMPTHDGPEETSRDTADRFDLDLTVPDTARMVDYWLGGRHNFEVDRTMAKTIERHTQVAPHWIRAQREFLRRVVTYLRKTCGHDNFLVAGCGLPTCANVHEVAPEARVIYTDVNPVTVAYGRHILGNNPNVVYLRQDARSLQETDPRELANLFHSSKRMAIIFIGIAYFLPDDVLSRTMRVLYDWVAPGSHVAITSLSMDTLRYAAPCAEAYAKMGQPVHPRDRDQTSRALEPWVVTQHGVRSASHWGLEDPTEPAPPVFVHGCLASKSS